ncbi:MAG: hypothetical protein MUD00_03090 [Candidatus Pacebacteria bacterium]|jgi:hypothetical protein|nr:hypothetical protein [Candidatus Paceibacterota bacterium]
MDTFFKNFFLKKEQKSLIHEEFKKSPDGFWYWNSYWNLPFKPEFKVGFAFNDISLLDDFPFIGKIGLNTDGKCKYYGLVYGHSKVGGYKKDDLVSWVNKFPESQFFAELDDFGVAKEK